MAERLLGVPLVVAVCVLGCEQPGAELAPGLPSPNPSLSAKVFCRLIYRAPRRQLDSTCSAAEKKGK